MAKYRINNRGTLVSVKSRIAMGEKINERELALFEQQLFHGYFRPRMEGSRTLIYTAPDVIGLQEYLREPIRAEQFFTLIAQTLEMVKGVEQNGLLLSNLILDMKLVFVNRRTREAFFIYQPIISRRVYGNVYEFLRSLAKTAWMEGKDLAVLQAFEEFLADPSHYRVSDVEAYVRGKCPQVYRKVVAADAGKSGFITNDRVAYENHYQGGGMDGDGTTLLMADEGGTTLLSDDMGTVVLTQEQAYPFLVREKTGERVVIDREHFWIGKEAGCDYSIGDNKAVSRRHAVIEHRNGVYYITDENSTNHTYVNESMIKSGVPCELTDGAGVRIADEEFVFMR